MQVQALQYVAEHDRHGKTLEPLESQFEVSVAGKGSARKCKHRKIREALVAQGPVKQRRIIGSAARSACLAKKNRAFFRYEIFGFRGFEKLTDRDDGRVTGIVVDVAQAQRDSMIGHGRQKLHRVAEVLENMHQKRKMDRCHLRNVKRTFAQLLRSEGLPSLLSGRKLFGFGGSGFEEAREESDRRLLDMNLRFDEVGQLVNRLGRSFDAVHGKE